MKTPSDVRNRRHAPDTYMRLIRAFPLKPIKDDKEHAAAAEIIGELIGQKLDAGAGDYLDTLILLVNKYEDDHHTPGDAGFTPQQALRAIMTANAMTQADIGKIIGSEPVVSMFLRGRRELSKTHIRALATRFGVEPGLFF